MNAPMVRIWRIAGRLSRGIAKGAGAGSIGATQSC